MTLGRCLFLAAFIVPAGSGAARAADRDSVYAAPVRMTTLPDGRRINLLCEGNGGPTVLLEAGWSDGMLAWRRVQPLIARHGRVCAYDRAGLGFSDPSLEARDTLHIVEDLEALVASEKLPAPYVVVGYSMGGLTARLFADRNIDRMAGLVLVEPSTEYQAEQFRAALPRRPPARPQPSPEPTDLPRAVIDIQTRLKATASYQHTVLSELIGMQTAGSAQVAASRRSYGALPLVVLTSAENSGETSYSLQERQAFQTLWRGLHEGVAALSTRGAQRLVPGTSHLIILEKPQVVAAAVAEVIAAAP